MKFYLNKISLFAIFIYIFSTISVFPANEGSRYAKNSVLSKGNWYKIKIENGTGFYKLTYDELKKIGLSDPKNVQIYGYGGWVLDQDFTKPYIDDLPQVGIWMSNTKENFGSGDYILFYGQGDIKWEYNSGRNEFVQTQNTYSFDSFYFVTESTDNQPNLIKSETATPKGNQVINSYQDYYLHEKELMNIAEMGRLFVGEDFKINNNQTFNVPLPGVQENAAIVSYNFVSRPVQGVTSVVELSLNGEVKSTQTMKGGDFYAKGTLATGSFNYDKLIDTNALNIKYTQGSSADKNVKLDYFRINFTRKLQPYGAITPFRTTTLNSDIDFQISNVTSSNAMVFDVTNPVNPIRKEGTKSGTDYTFNANNSSLKEFVLVDPSKTIPSPALVGKIKNQDLHSLERADMLIIVRPLLQSYAEELAQIHLDDSGLTSLIVNPEDIYNEFSSGKPDISAYRRFVKMFYDRAASNEDKPKYLLLFGDGTYDNRLISSLWSSDEKNSMLLTYQTTTSVDEMSSYVTDDYLGFLDDSEGTESSLRSDKLDISIGRIPVRNRQEASVAIQKIKRYMSNPNSGIWQNNLAFVADDAVASDKSHSQEIAHITDIDSYTSIVKDIHPEFIISKLYLDAYEREQTANGARYPTVKEAIMKRLNEGTTLLTFSGHGSPNDWTHEYVLTHSDIEGMSNTNLPVWLTATCDFTRFDQDKTSGGEAAFLNPNGGAVALFSTTRVVIIPSSRIFCSSFFRKAFEKENGASLRLGDILRLTKLDDSLSTDHNKLRYLLFGDPALKINLPQNDYKIKVETINDEETDKDINIQALSETVIRGSIVDNEGNVIEDFNGNIESVIFDSEQKLKTRGHRNPRANDSSTSTVFDYTDFTNTIYTGTTAVENGKFEVSFVTPKDILYSDGYGKMSFFASNNEGDEYVQGAFTKYTVNGTDPTAVQETNAPTVDAIYLNKAEFKNGATVNSTPLFYAEISDDTGINLAGGIGHTISLTVDGKNNYDLTKSFVSKEGSHKSGSVYYQLPKLSDGKHSFEFKAWDVWNNSVTKNMEFIVSDDYKPSIYNFSIMGNPAKTETRFIFSCDTPGSTVNIRYAVYSMSGQLLWMNEEKGNARYFDNYEYVWNLHDNSGMRLNPGVYICRILVSINGEESSEAQRLVVLGQ